MRKAKGAALFRTCSYALGSGDIRSIFTVSKWEFGLSNRDLLCINSEAGARSGAAPLYVIQSSSTYGRLRLPAFEGADQGNTNADQRSFIACEAYRLIHSDLLAARLTRQT